MLEEELFNLNSNTNYRTSKNLDDVDIIEAWYKTSFSSNSSQDDGLFNKCLLKRRELIYKPDEYFFQHNADKLEQIICNRILYIIFYSFDKKEIEFNINTVKYNKELFVKNTIDILLAFLIKMFDESSLNNLFNSYKSKRCIDRFLVEGLSKIKKGQCNFFRGIDRDENYINNKKDNILKLLDYAYMLNVLPSDYKNISRNFLSSILLGLIRIRLSRDHYVNLFTSFQDFLNQVLTEINEKAKNEETFNNKDIIDVRNQIKDINKLINLYKNNIELVTGCFVRQIGTFCRRLCKHYKELDLLDLFSLFYIKLKFAITTFDAGKGSISSYVSGIFRNTELMISAKQKTKLNEKCFDPDDRYFDRLVYDTTPTYELNELCSATKNKDNLIDYLSKKLKIEINELRDILEDNPACFSELINILNFNKE